MPIRVLIADDHVTTRWGVRDTLEERGGFDIVAEAADGDVAVLAARRTRPDVCLLDLNMPGGGVAAARAIRAELPDCVLLALTVSDDSTDVLAAVHAGFDGYLLKAMSAERLPDAIQGAMAGEVAMPRRLMRTVVTAARSRPERSRHGSRARLTDRELDVLDLLAEGLTTKEAARRLGISPVTVRRHVSLIVAKLGVRDRDEALARTRDEPGGDAPG